MSDLALILILAGAVSLVFKKLKQPLVLGYIVAGFLAGKNMPYMPSVEDTSGVETWSQIGVIFLMFTLGLEFSFKKIVRQGPQPLITAMLVMLSMMGVGNMLGHLFGWSNMDSMFLGGMLAMSSTTIIFKAFSDLGLMQKRFAPRVLSVLVLEDILGILLMVVLSGMAVSRTLEGMALFASLLKLGFFLILWFVVGIFLIPTILRRTKRLMSGETLLIVSIACCFLLVVVAANVGYSTAFGAFMMGSILAETVEAERIERLVSPVKDLFGAIFFVSVGMLVDPNILVEYWLPILVITLGILMGQTLLGTASFMLTGHTLRTSVRCGFSLAQVGEFAFIIASMGAAQGVTSGFLYPVIVAVSIVTTFLTPYMIRGALALNVPAISLRHPHPSSNSGEGEGQWRQLLSAIGIQTGVYFVLTLALIFVIVGLIFPVSEVLLGKLVGSIVASLIGVALVSPFLRPIMMRKNHSSEWRAISSRSHRNRVLLRLLLIARFLLCAFLVYSIIVDEELYPAYWSALAAVPLTLLICASNVVKKASRKLEMAFRRNLSAREGRTISTEKELNAFTRLITATDDEGEAPIKLRHVKVEAEMPFCHKALRDSRLREDFGCQVVGLQGGDGNLLMPDADYELQPGDTIWVVGAEKDIARLIIQKEE